ncbi:MAG: hypothetical protein GX118_00385 [Arcobacter butzleri]|jgi:copper chaperone NosL|nr:hypothetical protein [Arcobacteraceae bacterium]MDY0365138.1 hypothetical protein [Arcobacteraceae bacterium]NLO16643.1 hypothetical protein [Aliarcobacter butzleri]
MKDILLKVLFVAVFFFVIGLIIVISHGNEKTVVVVEGNLSKTPIEMVGAIYQDSDCGMDIEDTTYASQVISPEGKTWFFHDHGSMINWLCEKPFCKEAVIWVWAIDKKDWVKAQNAFYSVDEITPMNYGFGAYYEKQKGFIDFDTMTERTLRGENMANPAYVKFLKESSKY